MKALDKMGVPYFVCVERQEYDEYAEVIDEEKLLAVPHSNVIDGLVRSRNWIWNHAREAGFARHWQIDDNITNFLRHNDNLNISVTDGTIFKCMEDFVDRYENVPQAGPQYEMFAIDQRQWPAFALNTRVYSIHLLCNKTELDDGPLYFRGPYNDDTDLSLRLLKAGYCTILFYAFLAKKMRTMTVAGGNVPIYVGDGRRKMADALKEWHPDVTEVVWKWGRWQHSVNYKPFKRNKLIRKAGWNFSGVDNYGMKLIEV